MLRVYLPVAFIVLFAGWVLYRLLIKKDLRQNLNSLYAGLFFIALWGLVYCFMRSA